MLVKDLGLEHGNSVQPPATHDVKEEELEPLVRKLQMQVACCKMFGSSVQIEQDIAFTVNGNVKICQQPTK